MNLTERNREIANKLENLPFHNVSRMHVSGATVCVGMLAEKEGDALYLWTDDLEEPIYFNPVEAQMIISSLQVAIHKFNEE